MTFPVFTSDGLKELQDVKARLLEQARGYIRDRKEALGEMESTANPIRKAMLYRRAFQANELYSFVDFNKLQKIPSSFQDVFKIDGDLWIGKRGPIWMEQHQKRTKNNNGRPGPVFLPKQREPRIDMGTATTIKTSEEDDHHENDSVKNSKYGINPKLAP